MKDNVWIVTLAGDLGSGKGTVCQILRDKYSFRSYSTGDVQRQIASKYNMTTLELNQYAETHPEIDDEIDCCFTKLSESPENIIVDSRMAWHFIPESFKVYLKVDLDEAARRIMSASRGDVESYSSKEEAKAKITERTESEKRRFLAKYGVNRLDMKNYNFIIDTTDKNPEAVAGLIVEHTKQFYDSKNKASDNMTFGI